MGVYLFAFLFFFMALGVPIAFAMAMGLAATIHVWGGISFSMLFQQIFQGINSFTFIAVPMFILAGELMSRVGIIDDILLLCRVVMGWVPGSLANANIVASMFFAGVSGSAVADTSAIGGALIPAMVKEGYDDDFSVAVTASSSVIGPIIPPSIGMVLYGATLGTSISAMFMGGLVPGILLGLGLMIPATYLSIKRKYPRNTEKYTPKQIAHAFVRAIPALLMPVIILGGILGGVCSPTEAASVAILYSIIVGVFYYRSLNLKILVDCMVKAMIQSGAVLLIAAVACPVGWLVAMGKVPVILAAFITSITSNKFVVLLLINIFLLILGCIMDVAPLIVITTPVLLPVVTQIGMNPIQFGMMMLCNLAIGMCTPPVGATLFAGCAVGKIPMEKCMKGIVPFYLAMLIVVLLVTYVPAVSLTLPTLIMGS